MKISKSLLSAIAAGIVMTAATSCDTSEVVEIDGVTIEASESERGDDNNNGQCGTDGDRDNCPACGMG